MDFQPSTSLHLSLPSKNNINHNANDQAISLELVLDQPSSSSSSSPHSPAEPRIFSCNYCQRKFYCSQALGGHQNAHKLERTLAKKSRELSSVVRVHGGSNTKSGLYGPSHGPRNQAGFEHHGHGSGRFGADYVGYGRSDMDYGSIDGSWPLSYRPENVQDELSQLDLSLRL